MARMRLLTLMCLSLPLASWGYPIPPQSLWTLSERATVVVDALVDDLKSTPLTEDIWTDTIAVLHVQERWKGDAPSVLEVPFGARITCPAPPRYLKGRRVVAFLVKDETGAYSTVALSYGTRYPADDAEREAVKRTVTEAVALQRQSNSEATSRWALNAFASPATRWDALFTLRRSTNEAQAYYARQPEQAPLSSQTLDELERLFIARPSFDHTLPQVLALFRGRPSKALDAVFIDVVETLLVNEVAPRWMRETLDSLEARLASAPPKKAERPEDDFARELEYASRPRRSADDELQRRWDSAKRRLSLTPRLRTDYQRHVSTPTGGETPF